MITKTLNKLRQDKAKGILIIPVWKSAPYWPIESTEYFVIHK
jgi:hypothetical protein